MSGGYSVQYHIQAKLENYASQDPIWLSFQNFDYSGPPRPMRLTVSSGLGGFQSNAASRRGDLRKAGCPGIKHMSCQFCPNTFSMNASMNLGDVRVISPPLGWVDRCNEPPLDLSYGPQIESHVHPRYTALISTNLTVAHTKSIKYHIPCITSRKAEMSNTRYIYIYIYVASTLMPQNTYLNPPRPSLGQPARTLSSIPT